MKISFNWLKQFVDLPDSITAQEVGDKLKMSTVEVEGIEVQGQNLDNVVIGKVLSVEKHPNADKLQVCQVDVGSEKITIVCGGSNVSVGMLTVVAKNGSKVKWHGEGELIELKPTSIRGVESNGMICGADEVGLLEMFPKSSEKEIVEIKNATYKPGTPVAEAFGMNDAILEIDNKSLSNRPDLWGHYGIAREVAALFNREVKVFKTKRLEDYKIATEKIKINLKVEDEKFCSAAMFVAVSGLTVGPSPAWLQQKLLAVGQRPINNVVDITNYIMFEMGKPMHAFDVRSLQNAKGGIDVVVRPAKEGEELTLIGGKKLVLNPSYQIVGNKEVALSLAGIMGGENSGVTNDTTTVVFETAIFEASAIRKASTALGIRTDSSARFEKSLDSVLCLPSLERAVELILECCPGAKVASSVAGIGGKKFYSPKIEIPVEFFKQKIGVEIPTKTIVNILTRLGFGVVEKKKDLIVTVPSWRATKDVSIAEDVVEEVLRMYGYDQVPSTMPTFSITPPVTNMLRKLERLVGETLVKELAYTEVYNYSFVSGEQITKLGDDASKYLELDNPISKEKPYIRRNLLPNMIENIVKNIDAVPEMKIFEIGKVYHGEEAGPRVSETSDELLPRQDVWVSIMYTNKKDSTPFWEAKRAAEALIQKLNVKAVFVPYASQELHAWQHPARACTIQIGETVVGRVYELHPTVAERFGLGARVGVCAFNLSTLNEMGVVGNTTVYKPVSLYPEVARDIAFVVAKGSAHDEILSALKGVDSLVTHVELFDVFSGKNMPEDKKSMAYRITFASAERTLVTEEVESVMKKIVSTLKEKFGAEVR